MAKPTQYTLSHKKLVEVLIKQFGIHEGRWMISANFIGTTGIFGPKPQQVGPGTITVVSEIGIEKAHPNVPETLIVDAAVVNPAGKPLAKSKARGRKKA